VCCWRACSTERMSSTLMRVGAYFGSIGCFEC
jgi:hypothetical protein